MFKTFDANPTVYFMVQKVLAFATVGWRSAPTTLYKALDLFYSLQLLLTAQGFFDCVCQILGCRGLRGFACFSHQQYSFSYEGYIAHSSYT